MSRAMEIVRRSPQQPVAVSVVLPVNRDDGHLGAAIASTLAQTFDDLELIIVANNGPDSLWDWLLALDDPRLVLVRTGVGQVGFAANLGIELARAPLVARMDGDDICHPERLARQVAFLAAHPDVDVLGSAYRVIDAAGAVVRPLVAMPEGHDAIVRMLPWDPPLANPTVMARRHVLIDAGGFAFGPFAEDWELWLRLAAAGRRFANLPEPLLDYRSHGGQATAGRRFRRNLGHVIGLLLREAVVTGRPAFLAGAMRHAAIRLGHRLLKPGLYR